jgi:glycosyltransferase involved in cell wall biosynthesis
MSNYKTFSDGFTVLMAVYQGDSPKLLNRAIKSVLENSLFPDKFVICVDGPLTDEIELEIDKWISKFPNVIKLIRHPKNKGLSYALNRGIENIETDWIVRADADDINHKNRFQMLADLIKENPQLALVGSYIREVDEFGYSKGVRKVPLKCKEIYNYAKKRNPFNHMSVAYRKSAVIDSGLYPNIRFKEDYALWVSMIKKQHLMINIDSILVNATVNDNFFMRRGGIKYIKSEFQLQKFFYKNKIKSLLNAVFDFSIRSLIFSLPQKLRKIIYSNILRAK